MNLQYPLQFLRNGILQIFIAKENIVFMLKTKE